MGGWQLISTQGDQRYTFPTGFSLAAGAAVVVTSGPNARDDPANGVRRWTTRNIWNNSGDPGELRDAEGEIVATSG